MGVTDENDLLVLRDSDYWFSRRLRWEPVGARSRRRKDRISIELRIVSRRRHKGGRSTKRRIEKTSAGPDYSCQEKWRRLSSRFRVWNNRWKRRDCQPR